MAYDYKELKAHGFMQQKQPGCFSMRLKSVGGKFTAAQLQTVQEVAEKFGEGYVHLTSRQGIEIPFIKEQDIEEVKKALAAGGLATGLATILRPATTASRTRPRQVRSTRLSAR